MAHRIHINIGRGIGRGSPGSNAGVLPKSDELRGLLRRAVRMVFKTENVPDAELSLTLLDDQAITELNQRYRNASYATDVLAFALNQPDEPPLGDVYIGWAQALRQADEFEQPPAVELARLAIHGTLHVLGYDHAEGPERAAGEMWLKQEQILQEVLQS
jgi:probable rRNA maturation factor